MSEDSVVYAFFHCDDPESGGCLQSLHYSKDNAERTMELHKKEYIEKNGEPHQSEFWVSWWVREIKIQP